MDKKIKPGHHYYTREGLKPLIVYVKATVKAGLKRIGKDRDGGMQEVARTALEEYVNRYDKD